MNCLIASSKRTLLRKASIRYCARRCCPCCRRSAGRRRAQSSSRAGSRATRCSRGERVAGCGRLPSSGRSVRWSPSSPRHESARSGRTREVEGCARAAGPCANRTQRLMRVDGTWHVARTVRTIGLTRHPLICFAASVSTTDEQLSPSLRINAQVESPTLGPQAPTVPHPVSWTHVCATRHGVARIPRALRAACDTPAFRGASTGCSV